MGLSRRLINMSLILSSGALMLAFQNCGQTGSINVNDSSVAKATATVGDDIPKDNNDSDTPVVTVPGSPGSSGSPTSNADMPKGPVSPGGNTSSDIPKDPVSDGDDDGGKCDHEDHDSEPKKDLDQSKRCGDVEIVSFHFSVDVIGDSRKNNFAVLIRDEDIVLIPGLNRVRLKATVDVDRLSQVKILLNEKKSFLKTADGQHLALSIPSAEASGLKANLISQVNIKKGEYYELEVEIDIEASLVENGKNGMCKFKPVIHAAKLLQ